jgi:hypothetical protein
MTITLIDQDTGNFVDLAIDESGRLQVVVASGITLEGDINVDEVDIASLPGTTEADIAAIKTAVEILDNFISGNEGQVDVLTLPGTVQTDLSNIKTAIEGTLITSTVTASGQLSGQVTVATAGTAVQGPSVNGTNGFYVRALDDNLLQVFVGNDGADDVTSANGYQLSPGESIILHIDNMNEMYVDSIVDDDGICWVKA